MKLTVEEKRETEKFIEWFRHIDAECSHESFRFALGWFAGLGYQDNLIDMVESVKKKIGR